MKFIPKNLVHTKYDILCFMFYYYHWVDASSGIRPFLEVQERPYMSQTGFILRMFSRSTSHGMPLGNGGLIMEFPSLSTKQWNYLLHSWELGLQTPGHIHAPMGHACPASRT